MDEPGKQETTYFSLQPLFKHAYIMHVCIIFNFARSTKNGVELEVFQNDAIIDECFGQLSRKQSSGRHQTISAEPEE